MAEPDRPDDLDRELARRARDLPRSVPPPRDLWPGISARLDPSRSARRAHRGVVAAFVGAVAVAAAVALVLRDRAPERPRGVQTAASEAAAPQVARRPDLPVPPVLQGSEAEYVRAAEALRAEYEARRASEPSGVASVVDANVRILDEAISAVRAAVAAHPDDPELRADLDRVYQDKLDVLRAATELPPGPLFPDQAER